MYTKLRYKIDGTMIIKNISYSTNENYTVQQKMGDQRSKI